MSTIIHVAISGSDLATGDAESPLRTISAAAERARPGDTVLVQAGVYREWVAPPRGGLSDRRRITFTAAPGEHVVIKGSEAITGWERQEGSVWKVAVPNSMFGEFNPFAEKIEGDWLIHPSKDAPSKHLGDVYLNGRSFYEVATFEELAEPVQRTEAIDNWTGSTDLVRDPDQTRYLWYAKVDVDHTTIWANFQGADPNVELTEINVRRSVFYPREHHIDYITVKGFELAQAATPWTPPTADQPGLIGPNWAKGWVIEQNIIHDAKCSAISIGKEKSSGHNLSTSRGDKPGYQYQVDSVFSALQIGWDKENIGSHVIRGNTIYDCGQNGIVGHMGCVFSTIEDNHIYNIAIKREFYGHEIGGIKLHAPIDVQIVHNRIHDCTLGVWLDWQTQGTRITRNVFYDNARDLFVEVSHGPYVVDHNILGSRASLEVFAQGGAYVNNLVCGTVSAEPVVERPTPYHVPHSTQVAGYAAILGGDDRYIGNIFLGGDPARAYGPTARKGQVPDYGTSVYNGHPTTMEEYLSLVDDPDKGDHERFMDVKQPVYIRANSYGHGATPFDKEERALVLDYSAAVSIEAEEDEIYLVTDLPEMFDELRIGVVTATELEPVRFVDADFENPDGGPVSLDTDLIGSKKTPDGRYPTGPIANLTSASGRIRVW